MRMDLSDLLIVGGAGTLLYGAWLLGVGTLLMVLGVLLLTVGVARARRRRRQAGE